MDLGHAETIFKAVYSDIDGYELSRIARKKLAEDKSYVYGEVTPEAFYNIIKALDPKPGDVFYDLGSGTGKAVVLASLLFDFSRCVGIELLSTLFEAAIGVQTRLETEFKSQIIRELPQIEFKHEDMLLYDFSDADIIFAHATCFSQELLEGIQKRLEQTKVGTRVVTVTHSLSTPAFRLFKRKEFNFTWGKATVHFYEHI